MTGTDERRAAETERERRARIKRHVQANAWHEHHDDDRPSRLIVHSFAGSFGADWDLTDVLDLIDRADTVEFDNGGMLGHPLTATADETATGPQARLRRRIVRFDVPPLPPEAPAPDRGELAHLRPQAGDRVRLVLEGTVSDDPALYVATDLRHRRVGTATFLETPVGLTDRTLVDCLVVEPAPAPDGTLLCMNHDGRPAVGGIAVCAECRDALTVPRRKVRDEPQA